MSYNPQSGNIGLKASHGFGSLRRNEDTIKDYKKEDGMENHFDADVFRSNKSIFNKAITAFMGGKTNNTNSSGGNNTSISSKSEQPQRSIFGGNNMQIGAASQFRVNDGFDIERSQNITRSFSGTMMNVPGTGWAMNGDIGKATNYLNPTAQNYIDESLKQPPQGSNNNSSNGTNNTQNNTQNNTNGTQNNTDGTQNNTNNNSSTLNEDMMAQIKAYVTELFTSMMQQLFGEEETA